MTLGTFSQRWAVHTGIAFLLITTLCLAVNPEPPHAAVKGTGTLVGTVSDYKTGEPLGWTVLHLEELNRSVSVRSDGTFQFSNLPAGIYTLKSFRIGYNDTALRIRIAEKDTTYITVRLKDSPLTAEGITVEADAHYLLSELQAPDVEVSGKKLRQNLGVTIAETIDEEPGIAQRTMGPAPARPVLRGLSGDRLLILEDGGRTGDLSHTASDHAVVIEPMTAERIEVIRGPESLLYGSNTLGGVVNVVRGYIPSSVPSHLSGTASIQGESVNEGYSAGFGVAIPIPDIPAAVHFDGSFRKADNIRTPDGDLRNTGIETANASFGMSLIRSWGYMGISGSYYKSDYGIPPDPAGGHPSGVNIDMKRTHFESRAEFYPDVPWIRRVQLNQAYSRYQHAEIEKSGLVGIEFGVVTTHFSGIAHLSEIGFLQNGAIGVWAEHRDYASGGLSFTPASQELSVASFAYQEAQFGRLAANASIRFDTKTVNPDEESVSRRVGFIRKRSFSDVSASVSGIYRVGSGVSIGSTLMRSFRAPGIEELFSEGPHLASYAYEVGNAELGKERGLGTELFINFKHARGKFHFAVFRNDIYGFIFQENTGMRSLRRADLFLYQYVGKRASIQGFESAFDWQIHNNWRADGSVSFVRGDLTEEDTPIPQMPPLQGKVNLRYEWSGLSLGTTVRAAGEQSRLGEFENPRLDENLNPVYDNSGSLIQIPTESFVVFDLSAQYYFVTGRFLHTLTLSVENAGNTEYRKHLNRVKEIMPEPGRNFKLLYKVYF